MSIPRRPSKHGLLLHPGEMLREEFLVPLGMTAEVLARRIHVPEPHRIAIVKERRQHSALQGTGQ